VTYSYLRTYRGPVRLVVLDLAGTVVDYGSCAPAGAFITLFERLGITVTQAQAREPMGLHKRDHIRALCAMPAVADQWLARYGRAPAEADIDRLYADFIPLQSECLPRFNHLIPGALETVAALRARDIQVAATTGYNRAMLEIVLAGARAQGLAPDVSVCAEDVAAGRPAPWMIFRSMESCGIHPPAAVLKVGDTIADIEAGLNAGAWSVGVAMTGNMLGLSLAEVQALEPQEREARLDAARARMYAAGAHYVIDSIESCPAVVERIRVRLADGVQPWMR